MNITINKKNVELKLGFKSMMMFENVTGYTFQGASLSDIITFFYCVTLTSCEDYSLSFDDFIKELDERPSLLSDFTDWFRDVMTNQEKIKKN